MAFGGAAGGGVAGAGAVDGGAADEGAVEVAFDACGVYGLSLSSRLTEAMGGVPLVFAGGAGGDPA